MARKKDNPLRGKFRDPPQEGNASIPAQADQEKDTDQFKLTDAPAEPTEAPTEPVAADEPAPEQADQGDVPAEPAEAPAEPGDADAPAPEQADQGDAPAEPAEAPAEPGDADAPTSEQADQGDAPAEPAEAPTEPGDADTPAPEQADQGDAPAEPAEAPAEPGDAGTPAPQHPEARFVKLADIKPLSGTYVKDVPREDYTELLDNIKAHGLEKPIILRQDEAGGFQLVDGFHRCEAMKQAGMLEILAEVYDMSPMAANRYRKEHHADPDIPIPGKLLPAHPPK